MRFQLSGPFIFLPWLLALLFFSGCGPSADYARLPLSAGSTTFKKSGEDAKLPVFYLTTRKRTDSQSPHDYYSGRRHGAGQGGIAAVEVSRAHRIGNVRSLLGSDPPTIRMDQAPSTFKTPDAFYKKLGEALVLPDNQSRDLLIFVHGYNITFEASIVRAAQLAYDIGGNLVPVAFSWPSEGHTELYVTDENNVDISAPALLDFLTELNTRFPNTKIHLIAHSLGGHVTLHALQRAKLANRPQFLANLIFAAPDVDRDEFIAAFKHDKVHELAGRTTLYVAEADKPLAASELLHGKYRRAGQAGPQTIVMADVDTIDVSLCDSSLSGHSYLSDNRAVLDDLRLLLVHDKPPGQRNLYQTRRDQFVCYLVRP
jgi:esterase/lipase superfamily enzyme